MSLGAYLEALLLAAGDAGVGVQVEPAVDRDPQFFAHYYQGSTALQFLPVTLGKDFQAQRYFSSRVLNIFTPHAAFVFDFLL